MTEFRTRRTVTTSPLVTTALDESLEYAIAVWRVLGIAGQIASAVVLLIALAAGHQAWWVLAGCVVDALLFTWLGFWVFGNPEWHRPEKPEEG